jgi:hypothetical protein
MALQPVDGLRHTIQYLNPIHNRYDFMNRASTLRKASTYAENNTNRINAHGYPCFEGDAKHDLGVWAGENSLSL